MADLATLRVGVDSREVRTATADLNALGVAAGNTEQKTNGLGRAFGGLRGVLAGLGFGLLASELISMADTFTNMQSQIRLVTNSTAELAAVQTRLFEMAQNSRVSYEGTVDLYARLARSTKALGVSQESVLTVTESINKALLVSGTSSAQASGALMQLGQAFASGTLRGDELNSVMEGMPRVATMIAEGMGITVGELRKLGAQGKLTGAEVFNAIMKMKDSVEVEAAKMPMTFGQSMTVLRNSLTQFVGSANETLGITKNLAALIALLANNLDVIAVAAGGVGVAFVALQASMGISFIASYIRSVVALQMALGATGTASAIFSAGLKMIQGAFQSLTATMMLNPFVAIATALIAVTTLLYANRDAQVEVGGQVVRFGDIFLGIFEVIKQAVGFVTKIFRDGWASAIGSIAPKLAWLGGVFDSVFSAIGSFIKSYINTQIGIFAGLWAAVKAIFVGEDITDAFSSAFKQDYVGGFVKQVGNSVVALANLGAAANGANTAATNLGQQGFATAGAGIAATGNAAKKAVDPLEKYRNALEQMRIEGEKIGMTPEQAKAYDVEKLAVEALAAGSSKLAKEILAVGDANAKKQAQYNAKEIADGYLKEAEAIGKTAIELKQMEINQKAATVAAGPLRNAIIANGAVLIANMKAVEDKKKADEDATKAADEYKKTLEAFNNLKIDINFDAIFGSAGKAMGGVVSVFDQMLDRQEKYNELVKLGFKDEATRAAAQQRNSRLQINQYANLVSSAKGFFKQGTTGYKIMGAAEKAFRVLELVMAAKSAAVKIGLIAGTTTAVVTGAAIETAATATAEATKTSTTLAGAAVRIPAKIAEGAASIFSALGPFGFPVVAAMIGVMAALGFGGKSVSQPSIPNAEEMQAAQGAGSVLGDSTAKSDSINRALEIMAANSNSDLEYSNQMLLSLRSIQNNMANLSNNVAKQISVSGGMFDTSGQRLGKTGSGGVLGMFGSSTTRELHDLGIEIASSSIAEIIAGGISGNTYQVVQEVKKKSGLFGIGGSTRTSYQTTTGSIDQDVQNSITGVIASLRQGLIDGAAVIGLDGAQAILDSFQVSIGKISLSGLTGQEIEEQLNAIFSKVGDQMAGALLPSLTEMQKIGEGLFETFARVAREYQVVDVTLASIGKEFGAVGIASVAARSALVQMFESLDQFVEQTNYFRDNFLTEAEQLAPVTRAVAAELERLGLSSIATMEQFKLAVLGLDLTSTAGQETYAALLQLAPAFKKVADAQTALAEQQIADAKAVADAAEEAAKAVQDLQNKRASMEIQLLEAQGSATEALALRRSQELTALDATLVSLQLQIYAAQDAKEASDAAAQAAKTAAEENARQLAAAEKLASDRRNLEIQLMEAQGRTVEALAARRLLELAAMDASLRGLQEQIWAAQAKAEADAIAAKAAEDAAEAQAKAAEDAANALQQYADALASVSQTVIDEINRLRGINVASSSSLLKAQFATLTAQARTGNLDALGKLPELSRSIEEATLGTATSALEVARIRAWLAASLSETLAVQGVSSGAVNATGSSLTFDGNGTASANAEQTSGDLSNMGNMLYNAMYQVAKNTGKSYELLDRWDGDGLPDIREDASDYY